VLADNAQHHGGPAPKRGDVEREDLVEASAGEIAALQGDGLE
jgi:hypothetical protein